MQLNHNLNGWIMNLLILKFTENVIMLIYWQIFIDELIMFNVVICISSLGIPENTRIFGSLKYTCVYQLIIIKSYQIEVSSPSCILENFPKLEPSCFPQLPIMLGGSVAVAMCAGNVCWTGVGNVGWMGRGGWLNKFNVVNILCWCVRPDISVNFDGYLHSGTQG